MWWSTVRHASHLWRILAFATYVNDNAANDVGKIDSWSVTF